jgi:hypothetical protein
MKNLKQQNKMHEHHDEESLVPCTMYDQLFKMFMHCNNQRNNKKDNTHYTKMCLIYFRFH